MACERNTLPGGPSNRLIRDVRSILRLYVSSRPPKDDPVWRLAWEWALSVAYRNDLYVFGKMRKRRKWPSASEIASQYLILCLAKMRESHQLRLPHHAQACMPAEVRRRLTPLGSAPSLRGNVLTNDVTLPEFRETGARQLALEDAASCMTAGVTGN